MHETRRDFFYARVRKTEDCWEWLSTKNVKGYGKIRPAKSPKRMSAHRFSWELHYGAIPYSLHVLHHCDNPACVRPDHLFLGTNHDNVLDKVRKGRSNHPWLGKHHTEETKRKMSIANKLAKPLIRPMWLADAIIDYTINKCEGSDISRAYKVPQTTLYRWFHREGVVIKRKK
jgi:hypothetical protein